VPVIAEQTKQHSLATGVQFQRHQLFSHEVPRLQHYALSTST
jgi:hypothetical protein